MVFSREQDVTPPTNLIRFLGGVEEISFFSTYLPIPSPRPRLMMVHKPEIMIYLKS
jgi:hypothetical protein